jgi:uncharacterized protein (TIGR02421 family)
MALEFARTIERVYDLLRRERPVRVRIPKVGTLRIDRKLPFMCLYRRPPDSEDAGTGLLVRAEASYFVVSNPLAPSPFVRYVARSVAETLSEEYGAFLIIEIWAGESVPANGAPYFKVFAPGDREFADTLETLREGLGGITVQKLRAGVKVVTKGRFHPPGMVSILKGGEARAMRCYRVGIEVAPIYRSEDGRSLYPLVLGSLRRGFSRALKKTFHQFSVSHTTHVSLSYHALGPRALVKAVWEVDGRLADIGDSFDFLLQATPVNVDEAWGSFRRSKYLEEPQFRYRQLPIDPALSKRLLFQIPVEKVEDITLERLFREKQMELDQKLTMLMNIGTARFLYGSLQLYGKMPDSLSLVARVLLDDIPARRRNRKGTGRGSLDAKAFAALARKEIRLYRRKYPAFRAEVQVRDDLFSGLMAARGRLLVGKDLRVPESRVEGLLSHEVGTHLLTYFNGRAQRFHQLYTGLGNYDELQEGLAVLSEYLTGGISAPRLRTLAARVLAVERMVQGYSFVGVFEMLVDQYEFERKAAYQIAMRVFRGGGLTKDALYLQGLLKLLKFIGKGGEIDDLFVGKIATHHVPLIRELTWRRALVPMPLRPRFLDGRDSRRRLEVLRGAGGSMNPIVDQALGREDLS